MTSDKNGWGLREYLSRSDKLRWLFIAGLLAVLCLSPFLRGLYFEWELLPMLAVISLSFGCCLLDQFLKREPRRPVQPLDWALLALVAAYALSLLTAVDIHRALVDLFRVSCFFMVYWMAFRTVRSEAGFNALLLAAYLVGIVLAAAGAGAAAGLLDLPGAYEEGHIRSALQYHNTLAIYLAGMSLAGLALSLRTERRLARLGYAAGNLLMTVVVLGSLSRGTWLVYPVGLALVIALIGQGQRRETLINWLIFFSFALPGGLGFLNSLNRGENAAALVFLLAALLAAVFMQGLVDYSRRCSRQPPANNRYARWVSAPKLALLGLFLLAGLFGAALVLPGGEIRLVPQNIAAKVERTSLEEKSIKDRLSFDREALKIARDYPLTGAGGGGWETLYHSYANRLYWSREVHNYYFQTLVEAGILGLGSLLAAAFFFLKLLLDDRRRGPENAPARLTLWGTAAALVIMGLHAAFDADFSLAAAGIWFFTLLGAVRGRIAADSPILPYRDKKGRKQAAPDLFRLAALLGLLPALAVTFTAASFHQAARLGEEGARALEDRNLDRASALYEKAARRDPWQAGYRVNLARIEAIKSGQAQAAGAHQAALAYAGRAAELAPYNSDIHKELIYTYGLLQEGDLRLAASQALVNANPLLEQNHEILAMNTMEAALYFYNAGQTEPAYRYFEEVLQIRQNLPSGAGPAGPGLNLLAGQASLLLGRPGPGQEFLLLTANGDDKYKTEAQLWLAAACRLTGDDSGAKSWFDKAAARDETVPARFQATLGLLSSAPGITEPNERR
jgi:O-antigen ligase